MKNTSNKYGKETENSACSKAEACGDNVFHQKLCINTMAHNLDLDKSQYWKIKRVVSKSSESSPLIKSDKSVHEIGNISH